MNTPQILKHSAGIFAAVLIALPALAQQPATSPMSATTAPVSAPPSAADMQKMMAQMMELSKPGENHKLLATMDGNWTYNVKMWMNPDPAAKPMETKGSGVIRSTPDGRFFIGDYTGQMQMPGADGKMKTTEFKGHGVNGYDNVKKKFVATWYDNMGTSITYMEGDYDPATKTVTYTGEMEALPGMKTSVRQAVKLVDKDHFNFEWFENRGGQEVKTMAIDYTRKK